MKAQVNEIQEGLQHFHGSETMFQIPLLKTRYTNGLKYFAEAAECFWLITDTSVIAKSLMNRSEFITIDFKRLPRGQTGFYGLRSGNNLHEWE